MIPLVGALDFVVGEYWLSARDDDSARFESDVASVNSTLAALKDEGVTMRWSLVFDREVKPGITLAEYLFVAHAIDRDIGIEFGIRLDKLPAWDEVIGAPIGDSAQIDGTEYEWVPSVGLAWHFAQSGKVLGVIGAPPPSRVRQVTVAAETAAVAFISDSVGKRLWAREKIISSSFDESTFKEQCGSAFPRIWFADDVWRGSGRFEGGFPAIASRLYKVLVALNDAAPEIWSEYVEPGRRIREMSASHDVDCSPESPKTHRNAAAMSERDARFGDAVVRCEWHAKLEPHRNRVHFHVRGGRVFVGVFADHLTT